MKKRIALLLTLVLSLGVLTACGNKDQAGDEEAGIYTPGVYKGVGQGNGGDVIVEVEVDSNEIVKIDVLEHSETPGVTDPAFEQIPKAVLDTQTTEVDTVAGCTKASEGLIGAITDAVGQAK